MKRIGILTYHTSINNGAVMQCYSLSRKVQETFPDAKVEVIDYRMPVIEENLYGTKLRQYLAGGSVLSKLRRLMTFVKRPNYLIWQTRRKKAFESVRDILPLSEETILDNGTQKLFDYLNEHYDVVVAGSDAIWNYVVRGFPNPYFLDTSVQCSKLTYAASCYGMSYEKIPDDQKKVIGEILESYRFLGVRDRESEKFVAEMGCAQQPVHTCDPTAFLDVDRLPIDVQKLMEKLKARGFNFNRPTIGMMGTDRMCAMIRKLYGKQYQIAALYQYCGGADVNLYDLTPYEWAYVFRYFRLTFTTFFHGTMLSLRNGTPVICVALETEYSRKHETKVKDLLTRLGLESCYFHTDYKTKNISQIKAKADALLATDCKADICARMDTEAQSHLPFLNALEEIIREK